MKTSKKGFTIVELTIVIAVIAILAAVLIPTFVSLVKKANNSADVQMVTNINKYLAALEVTDGKNVTMHEAVLDAKEAGYDLTQPIATNTILWNQDTDRFLAVDEDLDVIASSSEEEKKEGKSIQKDHKYWIISADHTEDVFSTYYIGNATEVEVKSGFDTGDKLMTVTYTGSLNVCIRTYATKDGGDFIVNTSNGEVTHYGIVRNFTLKNAKVYTECGYVYNLTGGYAGVVKADGAQFHQPAETDENATKVTGIKDLIDNVSGTAEYSKCYNNGSNYCLFCEKNLCDHNMSDPVVIPATCEGEGTSFSQCSKCHYVDFKVIPKLGHDLVDVEAKEPTCTASGQTAGKVCRRCSYREGSDRILPTLHNFVDGVCSACGATEANLLVVSINSANFNDPSIWAGFDKTKEAIVVKLTSDLDLTAEKFMEVLGVNKTFWYEAEGVTGSIENDKLGYNWSQIYAIDIVLNGYSLTIDGTDYKAGIPVHGRLRIRGTENSSTTSDKPNEVYIKGMSAFGGVIVAETELAAISLDSVNMTAEYNPIAVCYNENKITVNSSTLNLAKKYVVQKDVYDYIYLASDDGSLDFSKCYTAGYIYLSEDQYNKLYAIYRSGSEETKLDKSYFIAIYERYNPENKRYAISMVEKDDYGYKVYPGKSLVGVKKEVAVAGLWYVAGDNATNPNVITTDSTIIQN